MDSIPQDTGECKLAVDDIDIKRALARIQHTGYVAVGMLQRLFRSPEGPAKGYSYCLRILCILKEKGKLDGLPEYDVPWPTKGVP